MKVFLINLDKDKKRLDFTSNQLKKLDINFERFSAINPDLLTAEKLKRYNKNKAKNIYGRELMKGEIGCAFSHIYIYEKIIKEDIDISLILEDDIIIDPIFKKVYEDIDKNFKNKDWDYLSLNYHIFNKKIRKSFISNMKNDLFKKKDFSIIYKFPAMYVLGFIDFLQMNIGKIFGYKIMTSIKPLYLTGGYFISKQGAKKILNYSYDIYNPSDELVNIVRFKRGLKFRFISPQIIKQNESFISTIDPNRKVRPD